MLAKAGRSLGGSTVDRWILEELASGLTMRLMKRTLSKAAWYRMMLE